jgi:hypothetical protein
MATRYFNDIILAVARRLKSPRTLATDNNTTLGITATYSSAVLADYVNRSVKDMLIDCYKKFGVKYLCQMFPEYIKTSGSLTLQAGCVVKPADCFIVMNLKTSDNTIEFKKLTQEQVENVRTGNEKLIVPSATRPVFWEENGSIYTLGVTTGDVVARYIVLHQDILPISTVATNGNWLTGSDGAWTASTRLLSGTMAVAVVAGDVNKKILFRTATKVYGGRIENFVSAGSFNVSGDGLPSGNITSGSVIAILISDNDVDSSDIKLNIYFHSEIIDRAVQYGLADAKNNVVL